MNGKADLHLHTTASDGAWSPSELVDAAKSAGLSTIAVTDHDTVEGIEEAQQRGMHHGIEVISGVELSVEYAGFEVHLLGYFIDRTHPELCSALETYRRAREDRISRMVQRLQQLGCQITVQQVMEAAGSGSAGRPHVARVLVDQGYAESIPDAFDRWLANGRPGYVPRARLSLDEAVRLIHTAGGLAVCAHPGLLKDDAILPEMVELGLDGIEVVHSEHDSDRQERYNRFALEYGLLRTGGSDSHGPGVKKGLYIGEYTIPTVWVKELWQRVGGL